MTDIQSSGVDVNVISHKRQRYAVWYGGSLMASTVSRLFLVRGEDANESLNSSTCPTAELITRNTGHHWSGGSPSLAVLRSGTEVGEEVPGGARSKGDAQGDRESKGRRGFV